jgi:PAS domain S-box-containing protein
MAQSKSIAQGIDITERKLAEKALLREKHFFNTVMNSSPGLLFVFDDKGNTIQWNRNVEKVTGYSAKEIAKMNVLDFVAKEDQKAAAEAIQEVLIKGQSLLEINVLSKQGKKTPFYITGLRTKFEKTTCVICTGIDITERKRAEHQLRKRMKELRAFYSLAEITEREDSTLDKLYQEFANILPQSWQYPEIACARIMIGDSEFCTENFAESPWKQSAPVKVYGLVVGRIEVGYLEERPEEDEGPFLKEERLLIDTLAERLGHITERKRAEEALRESEERYRTILETMQDGYLEVDLAGNFTFVNDAESINLGYSKEELIGMNNRQYTDETTAKKLHEVFIEVYKTGEPVKVLDVKVNRKDGTKGVNEISVSLIRDSEGKPIGFRGISRDITERRQMEEALRKSEELFRSVAQTATEGIINIDSDGNVVFWNKAAEMIFGYSTDEMVGQSLALVMPERFREAHQQGMRRVASTGESRVVGTTVEVAGLAKDGHEFPAELSLATWKTVEGVFFTGIVRDITERKRAAELLQRYSAELERSNEEVKNFAYIVSHDLRVPLVNLKGYTSELRSALGVIGSNFDAALPHLNDEKRSAVAMALHEDVPEALEFITNSVSRMDSFINSILILARLGRQDLKPEPIDMNALLQTTVETMSHQLQERGIEVIVGSLPHVVADRTAMEQIMGNILSNAVKYLDSSRPGRIEVTAQANGAETTFRIGDNGRGIAAEDMGKVFAPFRRAGKQDTPGEGMGLAYVQTLLRRHGGRISCESELGKGTTFTFTISTRPEKGARDA